MRGQPKRVEFVVKADVPALLFSSKEAAEGYMEPIDVLGGEYSAAYDRTGLVYTISVENDHVKLVPDQFGRRNEEDVRELLRSFLASVGVAMEGNESLDGLLRQCEAYVDS